MAEQDKGPWQARGDIDARECPWPYWGIMASAHTAFTVAPVTNGRQWANLSAHLRWHRDCPFSQTAVASVANPIAAGSARIKSHTWLPSPWLCAPFQFADISICDRTSREQWTVKCVLRAESIKQQTTLLRHQLLKRTCSWTRNCGPF